MCKLNWSNGNNGLVPNAKGNCKQRRDDNNNGSRLIQFEWKTWLNAISITLMLTVLDGLSEGPNLLLYFVIWDLEIPQWRPGNGRAITAFHSFRSVQLWRVRWLWKRGLDEGRGRGLLKGPPENQTATDYIWDSIEKNVLWGLLWVRGG